MKRLMTIFTVLVFCLALGIGTGLAGTLYDQEGGTNDQDSVEVDGAGSAPNGANAASNWIYQYGSGSWSGLYAAGDGWETITSEGDMNLEVEADVEMYFTQSVSDNKIYYHIGNIYEADNSDLIAYVDGSFTSNNGQYIGISFQGTDKTSEDFDYNTGVISGGMQSDHDTWRDQDNQMDIQILLNTGSGWDPPVDYGDGAHNTVTDTLWWLVNEGNPGSYNYQWRIKLLPSTDQADGDYYLDPQVVATPVL